MKKENLNKTSSSSKGVRATHIYSNMLDQMRYIHSLEYAKDKKVVDIACGVGWGAFLLSKTAKEVIGVDLSEIAINTSRKYYNAQNITYVCDYLHQVGINDSDIDLITSFETIEHIEEPKLLIKEFHRILKKDGFLLLSTPNGVTFKNSSTDKPFNPFHVEEYDKESLIALFDNNWEIIEYRGQYPMSNIEEISKYRKYIKHYWIGMKLRDRFGFIGQSLFLILGKLKIFLVNEPAYQYSCAPQIINNDNQPAYHYIILKPKK
jgi:2-polyprenyl-3-methyl-5-hydroxy-6-metoxy-1,4-benzoquinol methylase